MVVISILAISGCGASEDSATAKERSPFSTVTTGQADGYPKLKLDPPDRPPPRKLLTRELKVGTGPPAHHGDRIFINYKGVDYETAKLVAHVWHPHGPLVFRLGFAEWGDTWEKGIEGMRVGGRREVIVPQPTGAAIDYVIDLDRMQPG